MFIIDKPFCFANIKAHNCKSLLCISCPFNQECCKEIQEGRGLVKFHNKKNSRDFDKIKVNGKIVEL